MPCKYTMKQIESNLANVMSRSRTINALDIHCMRSECHGVPSISNVICRENVLDILSGFSQRVEMISFNYHNENTTMKLDVVENAAVELQNLASGSRNAINVINKVLRTENGNGNENRNGKGERKKEGRKEGDGNGNNNHHCNQCNSMQRRDLVNLTQLIKKNPLEAKKIMLENKEHILCLGKINKNNGCGSCISKYVSSYTLSIKSFPTSQFYKDFVYTSEEDYGSLFSGMNTKTGMRHTGDDKRKQFKEFVIEPYNVKGYQVSVKKNQKNIAGHDITSSDFNLYQYSVSLDNRIISLMKALSDEIKDTILERSKSINLKSVEDLRIELQNSATILLDKVIKKSEWDDLTDITVEEKKLIAWMAVDNIIGYGIYTPLIYDQNITDIEIKEEGDDRYKITCRHLYSRPKKVCLVDASINKTEVENLVKNIVPRIAGTVGDTALFKNDTLETAGEIAGVGKIRCTINRPPITKGYHVELRKHAKKLSIPELMALGEASSETFSLLWMLSLLSKMSVMFVGPVGSGKTTLLVASQAGAPESLVWGVVGDIDELQGISGDYVLFKTIAGDTVSRDLVRRKLLRKRKDKVIVQEIRDQKDAEDYISQRQQGEAILSTTHARSIDELVDRFRFNFQIPEEYVYKSIDAVVVMNERDRQIIETVGIMDHEGNNKIYKILEFDYGNNTWIWKNKNGEVSDFSSALRDLSTVPSVRNALRMQENSLTPERFAELGAIGVLAINELLAKCFKKQPSGIYAPIISDKEVFRLTKECMQTAYDLYIHGFKKDIAIERLREWLRKQ